MIPADAPPHDGRDAAAAALFADALARFGVQSMKAGGRSMLPAIWPGDLLTITAADRPQTKPGDIVVVDAGNRLIVHRLVEHRSGSRGEAVTRGDAMNRADAPVPSTHLIGIVTSIRRGPLTFDPRQPVAGAWRLASAVAECVRRIRLFVSRAARECCAWRPTDARAAR